MAAARTLGEAKMEYGLQFANLAPGRVRDLARVAENEGYDLIVFPDHIVFEGAEGAYDPGTLAHDVVQLATVVAAATSKMRVGHLVLCNPFRHPVLTAQSLVTLDHVSNGQSIVGIGAGWIETEFRMTGISFPPVTERLAMLDESLTCMQSLWANERTNFAGKYYQLRDAILWPKPIQQPHPPILLGGGGNGLLRLAAKYADYLNIISPVGKLGRMSAGVFRRMNDQAFRERIDFVRAEAKRIGRDPNSIKISNVILVFMLVDTEDAARQTLGAVAQMFNVTPEILAASPAVFIGTPKQCVSELTRRAEHWSISQFIFGAALGIDEYQIRRLSREVISQI
jgi:probable F420-dependent oxidoreductase